MAIKKFPIEQRLLIFFNLSAPTEDQLVESKALAASSELDWGRIYELAELNAVLSATLDGLSRAELLDRMPADLLAHWQEQVVPSREQAAKRLEWVARILETLHEAGVEVIVLNSDLMVRHDDVPEASRILRELGFRPMRAMFGLEHLADAGYRTHYASRDMACVVRLHAGLVSPHSPWHPDMRGIWARRQAIEYADSPAFRMAPEDHLLNLCVSLPFFKTGLKELAEVYNFVLSTTIDWSELAKRSSQWRAEDAVFRVLSLTNAMVELRIPPKIWNRWSGRASGFTVEDTEKRLVSSQFLLSSRSTQVAKIEKAYAEFSLTENYVERVKAWAGMWSLLLWPEEKELLKLSGEPELKSNRLRWIRARVRAPKQLWNAMARDRGHLELAATALLNTGVLLKATAKAAVNVRKRGRTLREHPAVKLLETFE